MSHTDPASTPPDQPRQLLVFCDGTNNTLNGGTGDTHVLQLAQGLKTHNAGDPRQLVWYDPGVGAAVNLPEATLWNQFKGKAQRLWGLAFGEGVYENIAQAITFLSNNYEEGDQIYLFGFSRGAFTARAVGGVINQYGLPQPAQLHLLPLLIQRYFSAPSRGRPRDNALLAQARTMIGARRPFIHFVGVWDTVDEVGLPGLTRKIQNSHTLADKCFLHVRHVVALDEHRRPFRPRLYENPHGGQHSARVDALPSQIGSLKQVALPGCHSDIGGGYATCGLGQLSLVWMVQEAMAVGLRVGKYNPVVDANAQRRVHSEAKRSFFWALAGQTVRNANAALEPLLLPIPPAPPAPAPVPLPTAAQATVWQRASFCRLLFWLLALGLTALALRCLAALPIVHSIPLWQIGSFWGLGPVGLPATPEVIGSHLWRDLFLIASLSMLLALSNSAGFAYLAGLRQLGQEAPRWLNALGVALPVFVCADLSEDAFTAIYLWLLPCSGGIACVVALFMSLASAIKFVALAASTGLGVVGVWAEVAAWLRRW